MKKYLMLLSYLFVFACATSPTPELRQLEHIVKIEVSSTENSNIKIGDGIQRSMEIPNQEGSLSPLSFVCNGKAFMKIFSGLSTSDVTRIWNDFIVIENTTDIREINIFINSQGGDAFSGLALADEIKRARRKGFRIIAHASGIVASAAVPVFAVCDFRIAAIGTMFMVHEAALWKWPGRETASDIRSQNDLMHLLRNSYLEIMADRTKLTVSQWEEKEGKTTWFSTKQALEWGLVDKIE